MFDPWWAVDVGQVRRNRARVAQRDQLRRLLRRGGHPSGRSLTARPGFAIIRFVQDEDQRTLRLPVAVVMDPDREPEQVVEPVVLPELLGDLPAVAEAEGTGSRRPPTAPPV